jgi:hypothetical protein
MSDYCEMWEEVSKWTEEVSKRVVASYGIPKELLMPEPEPANARVYDLSREIWLRRLKLNSKRK